MITGATNNELEASTDLDVHGPLGHSASRRFIVDTGFDGELTLPVELIRRLQLPFAGRGQVQLADGSAVWEDRYLAVVWWDGAARRVVVDQSEGDSFLGMSLLRNHRLIVDVRPGGAVTIVHLP